MDNDVTTDEDNNEIIINRPKCRYVFDWNNNMCLNKIFPMTLTCFYQSLIHDDIRKETTDKHVGELNYILIDAAQKTFPTGYFTENLKIIRKPKPRAGLTNNAWLGA